MPEDVCPYCGAAVKGGFDGCFGLLAALNARAYYDEAYGKVHLLCVDTHVLQHAEEYSPEVIPFHLTRLCWLLEFGGDSRLGYEPRWMGNAFNGLSEVPLLVPPLDRGALTVASVNANGDLAAYRAQVRAWARAGWDAWGEHHSWARLWLSERGCLPVDRV